MKVVMMSMNAAGEIEVVEVWTAHEGKLVGTFKRTGRTLAREAEDPEKMLVEMHRMFATGGRKWSILMDDDGNPMSLSGR